MADISNLALLLRENGDTILNAQNKLTLTASLLQSLNEAFQLITHRDDDSTNSSFQVTASNNSKVEFLHDLQFLHDFVQKTVALKLSDGHANYEKLVNIGKFHALRYLELKKVPLLKISGLQALKPQLISISCVNSLKCISELLVSCGADSSSGALVWSELREASFTHNGLKILDKSLSLAPWLQILDLSYNKLEFTGSEALSCLPNLRSINMCYNLLESVPKLSKGITCSLRTLLLGNNYIEDISGLAGLEVLTELDLSCNCLAEHELLWPLLTMRALVWLNLEGNPLSFHSQHRIRSARCLHNSVVFRKFQLDRQPLSKSEQFVVGTIRVPAVRMTSPLLLTQEDTVSTKSSASEQTLVESGSFTGVLGGHTSTPLSTKIQTSNRHGKPVRKAVIADLDSTDSSMGQLCSSIPEESNSAEYLSDHLETKRKVERLRETFGEDNWLHSQGGSCLQDVLGLPPTTVTTNIFSHTENNLENVNLNNSADYIDTSKQSENSLKDLDEKMEAISITNDGDDDEQLINNTDVESESVTEVEDQDDIEHEDIDEGEQTMYAVQRIHSLTDKKTEELFLVVTNRHLKEREIAHGYSQCFWAIDELESCTYISSEPPTVQLTFDTIRSDRKERIYVMDVLDSQRLVHTLRSILDARPLSALNQSAFRCMKCSSLFSQEVTPVLVAAPGTKQLTCPNCGSNLVFEMDEEPRPIQAISSKKEIPVLQNRQRSPSQSSIGQEDLHGSSVDYSNAVQPAVEGQFSTCSSAASLDPMAESTTINAYSNRRCDSDIEIISNPSQSSIEVLDKGGLRTSSEERQMVPPKTELPISSTVGLPGLTESSSSDSLTDSICTAYETHIHGALKENLVSLEKVTGKDNISPGGLSSLLEDLLQNVSSKLAPQPAIKQPSTLAKKVEYSYTNFSLVDHRIKLYIYLTFFHEENEELVAFLRATVVPQNNKIIYPGCLVISTHKLYLLKITGPEGDDPEKWLSHCGTWPCHHLISIFSLPWGQGVGITIQAQGALTPPTTILFILYDEIHSAAFLDYLTSLESLESCTINRETDSGIQKNLHNLAINNVLGSATEDEEVKVILFLMFLKCQVSSSQEIDVGTGGIIVTTSSIVLTKDDLSWLFPGSSSPIPKLDFQPIQNLICVEMNEMNMTLVFLDEDSPNLSGKEIRWTLTLTTCRTLHCLLEAIRKPWEKLFSIPLEISESKNQGCT